MTTVNGSADQPTPQLASVPGGQIRYREQGEGPPVVFVHGLLVDGRLWDAAARELAGRGFRCIVPDWPMGSHTLPMAPDTDLSPPGMANIIASFLDALGIERATFVGNDSGGAMSQVLAANHPDRVERLVLTNCDTREHFPPSLFKLLPPLARIPGGMTALAVPFRLAPIRRGLYGALAKSPIPPELADSWMEPSMRDKGVRRDGTKVTAGMHKRHTLAAAETLKSSDIPVLLTWGEDDIVFKVSQAERLAADLRDATVRVIPDSKTFVPIDAPERLADEIAAHARSAPAPA